MNNRHSREFSQAFGMDLKSAYNPSPQKAETPEQRDPLGTMSFLGAPILAFYPSHHGYRLRTHASHTLGGGRHSKFNELIPTTFMLHGRLLQISSLALRAQLNIACPTNLTDAQQSARSPICPQGRVSSPLHANNWILYQARCCTP